MAITNPAPPPLSQYTDYRTPCEPRFRADAVARSSGIDLGSAVGHATGTLLIGVATASFVGKGAVTRGAAYLAARLAKSPRQ